MWSRSEPEAGSRVEAIRVATLFGYHEAFPAGENTTRVYTRYAIDLAAITGLRFDTDEGC